MRQADFQAHISQSEWRRLRQRKPSAGLVSGVLAITLAWVFSAIGLGPSQLQFGAVPIGSGTSLPVKLTNRGMTEFHAASVALAGEDAEDFDVDTKPCATVAAGATCVLWVDFRPRKSGPKHARLVVRTNDGKEFSSEFRGDASPGKATPPPPVPPPSDPPPVPDPSPTGIHHETTSPPPPTLPVLSQGQPPIPNSPPVQDPPTSLGGPKVPPAPLTQPPINPPVQPPVVVSPPNIRPPVTIPEPKAAPLVPHLTMTPGTAKFTSSSSDGEFYTSPTQTVIVRSDGTADIQQLRLSVAPAGVPFRYSSACRPYLAHGRTCAVQVKFAPQDSSPHVGTLDAYDGNVRLAKVDLHGIRPTPPTPKGQPHLTVNPAMVQFSGSSSDREFYNSPAQTVVVRNDGTADLRQLNLRIDPPAAPFSYSPQCPALLARGQSCTVQVRFAPRDSRQYAGTLYAYDGSQQAAVSLRGGGKSPSQPANPPGKGTRDGNPPTGVAGPGHGTGANGIPPRGPVIGTADGPPVSENPSSGGGKSQSQPANPPGKGTRDGNPRTGVAGPGQGTGANGVPPRGPVIGTADGPPVSENSGSGNVNRVAAPAVTGYRARGGNSPNSNSGPAPRLGNGVFSGSPGIMNGGAGLDNKVNSGISGPASAKPASPVAQRPVAPPRTMATPRRPELLVQQAPRRRPPGR